MFKMIFYTLAVSCFFFTNVKGQSFIKGDHSISLGFGFPNIFRTIYDSYEINPKFSSSGRGPYNVKYEYALTDKFGFGGTVTYLSNQNSWEYLKKYEEGNEGTLIVVLARGNYHFSTGKKLDPYIGVGLGYKVFKFDYYNTAPDFNDDGSNDINYGFPLGYSGSISARYYFTKIFGAYAEFGYDGTSLMQIGVAASF